MTNILDSRALGRADCYGQRFMKPGTYPYNIVPARGAALSTQRPFAIKVTDGEKGATMQQHNVAVSADGVTFRAEKEVEIAAGDMVLWNCNQPGAMPFAVVGDHGFFASTRLKNESGFSHAFGQPGTYHWVDAHGSKTAGTVTVVDPGAKSEAQFAKWRQALATGTVVMIHDGKVEPGEVQILTGQTVFFMVVNGPGITITDQRLLDLKADYSAASPAERRRRTAKG